jgi:transposase
MLYLGRLDNLTRERKTELEKKLKELKEQKIIASFYREINLLGYKESRYLIDDIGINEVLDFGDVAVQHKIFEKLGICGIINAHTTKGGGKIDVGRLAEIMAINRNCDPCSRRKLPSWFETTVLPILLNIKPSEVNDKLFLRAFHYLQEETTIPIQKEIYEKISQIYDIKNEKVYYDITSSYFEGNSCALAKFGYNRDGIKGKVQIVMGLVVNQDGILITHSVHPGNTADVKTVDAMNKRLRNTFGLDKNILVMDRGMISTKNVEHLDLNVQPYVFALRLQKKEKELIDMHRQNLKLIDDNTSLTEVILEENGRMKKYVVGHSKDIEKQSVIGFEARLKRVEEKLKKIKSDIDSGKHNLTDKRRKNISCLLKTEKVSKFIKLEFTDNGFMFERIVESIEKARKYNGLFIISTTEIDLSGEDILKIYREKDIIEKAFRTIKSEIDLRPFFLSSDESVTGYVFICALAYQVRSILRFLLKKSNSEMSIEKAFEILDRLKVVKISVEEEGVQVYRKVSVGGQRAIDVIHCFDVNTEFEKISCLNSV